MTSSPGEENCAGGGRDAAAGTLGIYIHIPFCLRKCSYCDFYSLPLAESHLPLDDYVYSLVREIDRCDSYIAGAPVESIYMGGGTPSLLQEGQVERIMKAVKRQFHLLPECEITLEANPATLTPGKLAGWRGAGINRISLGVQSFHEQDLQVLGRMHDGEQALQAIAMLQGEGFANVNLDLIYGIPGQTMERWKENLVRALQLEPAHLSLYLLQLEAETPLARSINKGMYQCNGEDNDVQMYLEALEYLEQQEFNHYEISNWSRPGYQCRHNLRYWEAREYAGFGAGAVSYLRGARFMNRPDVSVYMGSWLSGAPAPVVSLETMQGQEVVADALILGLRLCAGVDLQAFSARFGEDALQPFAAAIEQSVQDGLLKVEKGGLKLTKPGYMLSNAVFRRILT